MYNILISILIVIITILLFLKNIEVIYHIKYLFLKGESCYQGLSRWLSSPKGARKNKLFNLCLDNHGKLLNSACWPITPRLRKIFGFKIVKIFFRIPILVLATFPIVVCADSQFSIFSLILSLFALLSVWIYTFQVFQSRISLGYFDYLFRRPSNENKPPKNSITFPSPLILREFITVFLYLLVTIALVYSITYIALNQFESSMSFICTNCHQPLNSLDFIYFSIVTLATVGYGDIIPSSMYARLLTISEIVIGFCFVILLLFSVSLTSDVFKIKK